MKRKPKKTPRQKYLQERRRLKKEICKYMQVKKAIRKYGLTDVMSAMSDFVTQQRDLKNLQKKKADLENELKDINTKLI